MGGKLNKDTPYFMCCCVFLLRFLFPLKRSDKTAELRRNLILAIGFPIRRESTL